MIELAGRQWLDMNEVLGILQVSRSTWTHIRQRGGGPGGQLRMGRKLFWSRDSLLTWLHDCEGSSDLGPAPAPAAEPVPARAHGAPPAPPRRDPYAGVGEPVMRGAR